MAGFITHLILNRIDNFCEDLDNPFGRKKDSLSIYDYNCGGFAFETYNWFLPFFNNRVLEEIEDRLDYTVEDLVEEFDCAEEEDAEKNEEFRVCRNFIQNFDVSYIDDYEADIYEEIQEVAEELGYEDEADIECIRKRILDYHDFSHEVAFEIAVRHMKAAFPDLRIISDVSELKKNEYAIVYGTCCDDFHFAKYVDGKWFHKPGGNEIEEVESWEDAMAGRYYGKHIMFAKTKAQ